MEVTSTGPGVQVGVAIFCSCPAGPPLPLRGISPRGAGGEFFLVGFLVAPEMWRSLFSPAQAAFVCVLSLAVAVGDFDFPGQGVAQ